jgi:hypothetical protein
MMVFRTVVFMAASLALAIGIVLTLGYWRLRDDSVLAYILGIAAFVGAYWYLDIHLSRRRRQRLRKLALEQAGSPAVKLEFTNGESGGFTPTGAIWLEQGAIAVGFDPLGRLARYVQLSPLRDELWIDSIFGLEIAPEIAILDMPVRNLANSLRKVFGLPLRQVTVLKFSDGMARAANFKIYPDHIVEARDLVNQIGIQRSKIAQTAS